jgi:hypothetical protein
MKTTTKCWAKKTVTAEENERNSGIKEEKTKKQEK